MLHSFRLGWYKNTSHHLKQPTNEDIMVYIIIFFFTPFHFSRRQNSHKTLAQPILNYFLLTFAVKREIGTKLGKISFLF